MLGASEMSRSGAAGIVTVRPEASVIDSASATGADVGAEGATGAVVAVGNAGGAPAQALDDARSHGVVGMRERAGHFGGKLSIDSAPGQGTRVRLVMPLQVPAASGAVAEAPR